MSNTTLDGSGFADKSWFDICEEELSRNDISNNIISDRDTSLSYETKVNFNGNDPEPIKPHSVNDSCVNYNKDTEVWIRNVKFNDKVHNDDKSHHVFEDEDAKMGFNQNSEENNTSCSRNKVSPKNFTSYANILKSSPENREIKIGNLLSELVNNPDGDSKKSVKREIQKDFLQEELSLTSHLDVFHMQSPCKTISDRDVKQERDLWSRRVKVEDFPEIGEWSQNKMESGSRSKNRPLVVDKSYDHSQGNEDARSGKRRFPQALVSDSGQSDHQSNVVPDEVLMPSPSKMIRGFAGSNSENSIVEHESVPFARKRQRESYSSPSNKPRESYLSPCNRQREHFSSPSGQGANNSSPFSRRGEKFSSPSNLRKDDLSSSSNQRRRDNSLLNSSEKKRDSFSSPSNRQHSEVELETDLAVQARRQKQINYGKNTVGYERYTIEVPRHMREKNHPKTPPKHIKYSRRAWDGLIKVWRRRLHYWDPPSEGGGNPELLEGDMDLSSCDGSSQYSSSVPTTPQQECKRSRKAKNSESSNGDSDHEIANDFDEEGTGCQPLANDFDDYDDND